MVAVEVRHGAHSWGPAGNTGRGCSVEVWQGTLDVTARSWGPTGNTGRGCWRLRSGREEGREEQEEDEEEAVTDINLTTLTSQVGNIVRWANGMYWLHVCLEVSLQIDRILQSNQFVSDFYDPPPVEDIPSNWRKTHPMITCPKSPWLRVVGSGWGWFWWDPSVPCEGTEQAVENRCIFRPPKGDRHSPSLHRPEILSVAQKGGFKTLKSPILKQSGITNQKLYTKHPWNLT